MSETDKKFVKKSMTVLQCAKDGVKNCCGKMLQIEDLVHPALLRDSKHLHEDTIPPKVAAKAPEERVKTIEEALSDIAPVPKAMQSLKYLYRIGLGPSSSHTMGPNRAANRFKRRHPDVKYFRVTLYGSLALTGKGHQTDVAIKRGLSPSEVEIIWDYNTFLDFHPNGMKFEALESKDSEKAIDTYMAYSVGGGAIVDETTRGGAIGTESGQVYDIYPYHSRREILDWSEREGKPLWDFVIEKEGSQLYDYLKDVWHTMQDSLERGLKTTGVLPGGLGLRRRAQRMYLNSKRMKPIFGRNIRLFAYALAVSEENAAAGVVVTAPTCGACGVLPAVLRWTAEVMESSEDDVIRALGVAGLFGNIAKTNASISGAEVGCQGEVGVACAMAAAACAYLMGGTSAQVEHAAEMGLEHHLGLSCCPVEGLVQIPCIDRNAHAAARAVDCADFALAMDGKHMISYDEVVLAMKLTGLDMGQEYKETSLGGISITYNLDEKVKKEEEEKKESTKVKELRNEVSQLKKQLEEKSETPSVSPSLSPFRDGAHH